MRSQVPRGLLCGHTYYYYYKEVFAKMKTHRSTVINMTEGSPVSLIIRFSIPMLIGNLFQQLYNLVDSVIVGQFVGADALAAIGATGSVTFLFFAMCNGIGSGGGIIHPSFLVRAIKMR